MLAPLTTRLVARAKKAMPRSAKNLARPFRQQLTLAHIRLRMRDADQRLRPSFMVIGAAKAGTTSLFDYLIRHPQIAKPLIKEIQYFNFNRQRDPNWYFAHFPRADEVGEGAITGEATPGYLPTPGVPEAIEALLPGSKVIALLRDPVARTISHYHHYANLGRETRSMEEALFDPRAAELPEDNPYRPAAGYRAPLPYYVSSSFYARHLERWQAFRDSERMMIVKSEDMFANPRALFDQTVAFLGLPAADPGRLATSNAGSYGKTDPAIVARLKEIFAPENARLTALIGRDMGW